MRYSDGAPLLGYKHGGPAPDRRFVTYQKSRTLDEPIASEFEIAATGVGLFRALWLDGMKVRLIGIGVSNIRDDHRQSELFDSQKTGRRICLTGSIRSEVNSATAPLTSEELNRSARSMTPPAADSISILRPTSDIG